MPNAVPNADASFAPGVGPAVARTRSALATTASATPAAVAGYYDDFQSDTIGAAAANWTVTTGIWSVCQSSGTSQEYCATGSGDHLSLAGSANWVDLTYQAYVVNASPTTAESAIVARATDAKNYYELGVGPNGSGAASWILYRMLAGTRTTLATGSIAVASSAYYHLQLVISGTSIAVYAEPSGTDLVLLDTVTDSSLTSGRIGFHAADSSVLRFDNADVTNVTANAASAMQVSSPTPVATASISPVPSASPTPAVSPTPTPTAKATSSPTPDPTATPPPAMTATSADDFVASMGVDVDLTTPATSQFPKLASAFAGLGIRHTRIAILKGDTAYETNVKTFFASNTGVKAYGITDCAPPLGSNAYSQTTPSDIAGFNSRTGNHLDRIEGINEPNNRNDSAWATDTRSCISTLPNAVSGVPVVAPALSVAYQGAAPNALGNVSSVAAIGNIHRYFAGRNPATTGWGGQDSCGVYGDLKWSLCWARVNTPNEPLVVTETGWNSNTEVDLLTQAKYEERVFFVNYQAGIAATSVYMLADLSSPDDGFDGDALVNSDFSVKPAYTALANITKLLSDPGSAVKPAALPLAISPAPVAIGTGLRAMLMGKRDGSYDLAIWQEVQSANPDKRGTDTIPAARSVALTLGSTKTGTLHSWQDDGSAPTSNLGSSTKFVLSVTDRMSVVELR